MEAQKVGNFKVHFAQDVQLPAQTGAGRNQERAPQQEAYRHKEDPIVKRARAEATWPRSRLAKSLYQ